MVSAQLLTLGLLLFVLESSFGQRPFFAGRRTTVHPEMPNIDVQNRFGDELPIDALGDEILVNRISRLPIDKQPFWYINYENIQKQRHHFFNRGDANIDFTSHFGSDSTSQEKSSLWMETSDLWKVV